jgi:hypothetical protein
MTRIFRCKLQRADGMRVEYIGPFGQWSQEWHIVLRMVTWNRWRLRHG